MKRKYINVNALNQYIKTKLNEDAVLSDIYIKGEISNYRPHPSGHIYFTLKDEYSRIQAIMFASHAKNLEFKLENGKEVLINGYVSVYEAAGNYQLYVTSMQEDGIGLLYQKFEQLKHKLEMEGLFDDKHKKEIPSFPSRIAICSAKQGAALQDILRTIHLRFPFSQVVIFPIPVQGNGAYKEIIKTLKYIDNLRFNTIILARGGGSIEDLWNFNEEELARVIYDLKTPIISGVGHETDFTICDFVSDYRAATPTAAAIKATVDQNELKKHRLYLHNQLINKIETQIYYHKTYLNQLKNSYVLVNPEFIYSNEILRLNQLQDSLLHKYEMMDIKYSKQINDYKDRLHKIMENKLINYSYKNQLLFSSLDALSPLKIMGRGYTLIKKNDQLIVESKQINKDDLVDIIFYDGSHQAIIK